MLARWRSRSGTCGFSYKDWVGPVYPPGTKPAEMLPLYAHKFPVVEIDSSYYGVPAPATVASWARRTPDGFRFSAKLPGTGTHVPEPLRWAPCTTTCGCSAPTSRRCSRPASSPAR